MGAKEKEGLRSYILSLWTLALRYALKFTPEWMARAGLYGPPGEEAPHPLS